jgi:alpha-L-fucosidase 2
MNMWPANITGLSECNEPFFALLNLLHKYGTNTAASVGCRGYAAGLASDGWGFSDFIGGSLEWDSTLMGGHWAQEHLMEYYRFTQDKNFLKNIAWPILKDGSLFMLDWMRDNPENGMLIGGPGGSPENKYTYIGPDKKTHLAYINIGNTFTHEIAWETFSDTIECAKILGIDNELVTKVKAALKKVPPPEIAADGRIMEWHKPFGEVWKGHRHKSHLYGLYPGHQISISATPQLANAAEESLKVRMDRRNGDTGGGGRTGWNLAWSANLWARLHQGDNALAMIEEQLARQVNDNLFNRCGRPYQIDGNLGTPAGMAEMLIQSHESTETGQPLIRLLPALPAKWENGSVRGLHARGGFVVDINWRKGKFNSGKISSQQGGKAVLMIGNRRINVTLKKGESLPLH